MKKIDKLINSYVNANPYVKFLSVASLVSSATTLSTDIGNIISTIISEPPKIYANLETDNILTTIDNIFQKSL